MKRPRNKLPLSPLKLCVSALIHTAFTVKLGHTTSESSGDEDVSKEAILAFILQLITNSKEGDYSSGTGNGYSRISEALKKMDFGSDGARAKGEFSRKFETTSTRLGETDGLFRFIRSVRSLLDFGGISTIQDKPIVKK